MPEGIYKTYKCRRHDFVFAENETCIYCDDELNYDVEELN